LWVKMRTRPWAKNKIRKKNRKGPAPFGGENNERNFKPAKEWGGEGFLGRTKNQTGGVTGWV